MIKAAAIRFDDDVTWSLPAPARHHDIIAAHVHATGRKGGGLVQGFVTDDGRFLDREQAYAHALACGQISDTKVGVKRLFSEHIWPWPDAAAPKETE